MGGREGEKYPFFLFLYCRICLSYFDLFDIICGPNIILFYLFHFLQIDLVNMIFAHLVLALTVPNPLSNCLSPLTSLTPTLTLSFTSPSLILTHTLSSTPPSLPPTLTLSFTSPSLILTHTLSFTSPSLTHTLPNTGSCILLLTPSFLSSLTHSLLLHCTYSSIHLLCTYSSMVWTLINR